MLIVHWEGECSNKYYQVMKGKKIKFTVERDGIRGIIYKDTDLGLQIGMELEGMKIINVEEIL